MCSSDLRRCYFDPPWLPGHAVLLHKSPYGIWRLDYQVPDDISDEQALEPERLREHVQAHLDYIGADLPWEIEWVTLYKPNTLTLARYNHGRVLYSGDAAHLLPVFGVRGVNTGVQDGNNLAWKLGSVIRGVAPPSLLDTFTHERLADARQICFEAARSTRMMAPPSRGYRILRDAVLQLSVHHEFTRPLLHWRTSKPIDYADSPLTTTDATESRFTAGPRPGATARNVCVNPDAPRRSWLFDAFAPGFQVLVFGDHAATLRQAAEDIASLRAERIPVRLVSIQRGSGSSVAAADAQVLDPLALQVLRDAGISTEGLRSKSWDEFASADSPRMDLIITVCDNAAGEACPVWPGHPATAHWGYADPSQTSGSAEDMEAAFRSTLHQLHKRLESFINLPIESFDQQALQTQARSLSHT